MGAPVMTSGAAPAAKYVPTYVMAERERECVIKSPLGPELEWRACWNGSFDAFCCKACCCVLCIPCVWQELFKKVAMPTHAKLQTEKLCILYAIHLVVILPLNLIVLSAEKAGVFDEISRDHRPLPPFNLENPSLRELVMLAYAWSHIGHYFAFFVFAVFVDVSIRLRKFLAESFGWKRAVQTAESTAGSCTEGLFACLCFPCYLCGVKQTLDERAARLENMGLHDGMPVEDVTAMHMEGAARITLLAPSPAGPTTIPADQNYGAIARNQPSVVAPKCKTPAGDQSLCACAASMLRAIGNMATQVLTIFRLAPARQ